MREAISLIFCGTGERWSAQSFFWKKTSGKLFPSHLLVVCLCVCKGEGNRENFKEMRGFFCIYITTFINAPLLVDLVLYAILSLWAPPIIYN